MSLEISENPFRLIALYLPQFHPIPENDTWYGKGFTEWTNVRKAKPLFKDHYQPRIPSVLGYYDLRNPDIRQAQAQLAGAYGIEGFCYWHYWFGNGKKLLYDPFDEVLKTGEPSFPFCLGWANHSWYEKLYTLLKKNRLLIKQSYNGIQDYTDHFYDVLPAFQDSRYMTVDNKPIFLIFDPLSSPEMVRFIETWRELAIKNGLSGLYLIGQGQRGQRDKIINIGFDAFNDISVAEIYNRKPKLLKALIKTGVSLANMKRVYEYREASKYFITSECQQLDTIPMICPNWDHSPRSGKKGIIFKNSTPKYFHDHLFEVLSLIKDKPKENRIAIIKSWNEWGESNYLEPDIKFGLGYLEEINKCIGRFM